METGRVVGRFGGASSWVTALIPAMTGLGVFVPERRMDAAMVSESAEERARVVVGRCGLSAHPVNPVNPVNPVQLSFLSKIRSPTIHSPPRQQEISNPSVLRIDPLAPLDHRTPSELLACSLTCVCCIKPHPRGHTCTGTYMAILRGTTLRGTSAGQLAV